MKWPATFTTLLNPDIRILFDCLGGRPVGEAVRFVGGCVRNALLGIPVTDIDLATLHTPPDVMARLQQAGIKYVPTGIDHGTVTAVMNGVGYEITTLRRDVATDGRRAVVAYTTDWAEDAARRDFTINALYADRDGTIFDPLGQGLADLGRRKIVFVGDADTRIREDYLRILRFFRFHAAYGRGDPDPEGLAACRRHARSLTTLSRERITQEVTKILMGSAPHRILPVMRGCRILPAIFGSVMPLDDLERLVELQKKVDFAASDAVFCARLYTVLGYRYGPALPLHKRMVLSKKQQEILQDLRQIKLDFSALNNRVLQTWLYRFSRDAVLGAVMVAAAQQKALPETVSLLLHQVKDMPVPVCPVQGRDLLAMGHPVGVQMGKTLKNIERRWVASGFVLSRDALLDI